jgi:hypothetical protein
VINTKCSLTQEYIDQTVAEVSAKLTPQELGWFAGIVDGEGCIHIHRVKRVANERATFQGGHYYTLVLAVGNCDPRVVTKCRSIAHIIAGRPISSITKHRNGEYAHFQWSTRADTAYMLIQIIKPYLVSKPQQAEIGLKLHDRVRSVRSLLSVPSGYGRFNGYLTEDEMNAREELWLQLRALNATGKAREARFLEIAAE